MKKNRALVFMMFIFLPSMVYSQLEIGVKAGLNFSSIIDESFYSYNDPNHEFNSKLRWNSGLVLSHGLSDEIDIAGEVLYCNKGSFSSNDANPESSELSLHYINLNYLVLYSLGPKFQVLALLGTGLLVKSDFEHSAFNTETELSPNLFDISVGSGLRYNISKSLNLEIRYNFSINRVINQDVFYSDDGIVGVDQHLKFRNHVLQLNFIYMYSKK